MYEPEDMHHPGAGGVIAGKSQLLMYAQAEGMLTCAG